MNDPWSSRENNCPIRNLSSQSTDRSHRTINIYGLKDGKNGRNKKKKKEFLLARVFDAHKV
jgi:hypothetical protein